MSIEIVNLERKKSSAIWLGMKGRCPDCGAKTMWRKYLKVEDDCAACGLHLGGHQADDAPPYFTIFIVGHIIVPIALMVEKLYTPPLYIHALLFTVLAVLVSLIFLPIVKGGIVGLQWALRLHGFASENSEDADEQA